MSSFSPPYNWCDRLCHRCRLSPICEVATNDAPGGSFDRVKAHLENALRMLEKIASEESFSLAGVPALPSDQGRALLAALEEVDARAIPELVLRGKVARIAHMLNDPMDDALFAFDIVPNLFLIERLLDQLPPPVFATLRRQMVPLFERIPPPLRAAFDALVDAEVAPSPFCVVDDAGNE